MTFRAHWTVFENVIFRWFIRFVIAISALEPFLLHKFNWAVYLYSHDTKSPPTYCPSSNEQQTIVVASDTALQFCIHKWKQPDFFFRFTNKPVEHSFFLWLGVFFFIHVLKCKLVFLPHYLFYALFDHFYHDFWSIQSVFFAKSFVIQSKRFSCLLSR